MSIGHECEQYGSFEDWFLNEMDRDQVEALRLYGASCGVSGLINDYDIWALFDRFGAEIESLAEDATGESPVQIGVNAGAESVGELVRHVVWIAAEHLAVKLEEAFEEDEDCDDETDGDDDDDCAPNGSKDRRQVLDEETSDEVTDERY